MNIVCYDMNLTNKQAQLYVAIKEFIEEHNYSPSVRELCEILGKRSSGTICPGLHILKRKGYIDFIDKRSRTITIIKDVQYEKH